MICRASHSAVGCRVIYNHSNCRRPCPRTMNTNKRSKASVQNNTQINSGYRVCIISQKCLPILRRWLTASTHVFRDRRLSDLEPEHQKLTVDPGCALQRVLLAHPLNEFTQVAINPQSPRPPSRFPPPISPEARTMPAQDRVGLNRPSRTKEAGPEPN